MNNIFLISEANIDILEILLGSRVDRKIFCGHIPPFHNRLVLSYWNYLHFLFIRPDPSTLILNSHIGT